MSVKTKESTVSLDHLDDHLKAILKLKIREFVHLSPWFRNIPSIDTTYYPKPVEPAPGWTERTAGACPNRHPRLLLRKRSKRPLMV